MAEKSKFYYPVKVRFVETDAQGHVFFGHYLTYFDVGLTEYMHAIGFSSIANPHPLRLAQDRLRYGLWPTLQQAQGTAQDADPTLVTKAPCVRSAEGFS
jgi:hypothetical protein